MPEWAFRLGGRVNSELNEIAELLPRYRDDNLFDSTKFTRRFPDFPITTYREGVTRLLTA